MPKELSTATVSYTHLRAHETPEHLVCRLLLEKQKTDADRNTVNDAQVGPDRVALIDEPVCVTLSI